MTRTKSLYTFITDTVFFLAIFLILDGLNLQTQNLWTQSCLLYCYFFSINVDGSCCCLPQPSQHCFCTCELICLIPFWNHKKIFWTYATGWWKNLKIHSQHGMIMYIPRTEELSSARRPRGNITLSLSSCYDRKRSQHETGNKRGEMQPDLKVWVFGWCPSIHIAH